MSNDDTSLKKLLKIILIGLIIFLVIFWINQKHKKIEYEETVKLSNGIEFTIVKNRITKKLLPTNYTNGYSYYSLFNDEKSILDVQAKVKNTSDKSIKIEDIFKKAEIRIDKKNYTVTMAFEEVNGRDFFESKERTIEAGQELICHFGLGIDDDKISDGKNASLKIKANGGKYEYQMQIKSLDAEIKNEKSVINMNYQGQKVEKDELISIPNVCDFKILDVNFKDRVEPNNKVGSYRFYTASPGRKYLDAVISVKNSSSIEKLLEDMLGYGTLVDVKNDNTYNLVKVVEENNGTNLNNQTSIYKISANQEMIYHVIVEVPQDVINDTGELYINLYMNGENYMYQIR
ncbi:MAG: hypothetical protein IJ629_06245 [Clostridia bacterium]|nr:hypothetical protein [Clostridia bacterium]